MEMAIFNEWLAKELVAQGFKLVGTSGVAWFFEDSVSLERAVSELTTGVLDDYK